MNKKIRTAVSAVVLTRNNHESITACLRSLRWCNQIIVVDDYSTDDTFKKILNFRVGSTDSRLELKIFKRRLNGDFAAQRNFALKRTKGEWILFVDSDEIVSEILKKEILSLLKDERKSKEYDGLLLGRKDFFLGSFLKFGETASVKLLRLGKKDGGVWQGKVHETWVINGKIGMLRNSLHHFSHQDIASFLEKINWYTDIVAQYWKEKGRRMSFWEIFFFPLGKFGQNYILRLGFLDGIRGLIFAILMSFHSFLARGKLWLLYKRNK